MKDLVLPVSIWLNIQTTDRRGLSPLIPIRLLDSALCFQLLCRRNPKQVLFLTIMVVRLPTATVCAETNNRFTNQIDPMIMATRGLFAPVIQTQRSSQVYWAYQRELVSKLVSKFIPEGNCYPQANDLFLDIG